MSFIRGLIGLCIALSIAYLAITNRQIVELNFSPIHPPLEYPLYIAGLGALLIGFLLGATSVWLNNAGLRRTKRQQKRTIADLEKALKAAYENAADQTTNKPATDLFPALSKPDKAQSNSL